MGSKEATAERLREAEDSVHRAHMALLDAWIAMFPEDAGYYRVKELVDEVGCLRTVITKALEKKGSKR